MSPHVIDRIQQHGRARVIVELAENTVPEAWLAGREQVRQQRRRVLGSQINLLYELGGSDAGAARPYATTAFMALEIGPRALAVLERSGRVRSIREDPILRPHLDGTVGIVEADEAAAIGYDGTGSVVVVLDTGVDQGHQNFPVGKVVDEACFASGYSDGSGVGDCPGGGESAFGPGSGSYCTYDWQCFHGTHVAGIAVGSGPQYSGVAPGAGLIPIQVFSEFPGSLCEDGKPCPRSFGSDQDLALEHVYDVFRHSYNIAAVNMSLGSGAYSNQTLCDIQNASTKAAIDNLRAVGIATIISAGNDGLDGQISAPACISSAVSVSALENNDTIPTSWANRAPFLSLWAPGVKVMAPRYRTLDVYVQQNGTSMAAPHVAGAWAIIHQVFPTLGVGPALTALQSTGVPIEDTSRIRIHQALEALGLQCDDGVDNDGDGYADLADPGCADSADLDERSPLLPCDDGTDNDEDGQIDQDDPGCLGPNAPKEDPACDDGIDNDGDELTDLADPQCNESYQDSEAPVACGLGSELMWLLIPLSRIRRRWLAGRV